MGANVASQLSVPPPPIELSYLIKHFTDIMTTGDVTPQSIYYFGQLMDVKFNHIEVDVIITLDLVRRLALNGRSPEKILEML